METGEASYPSDADAVSKFNSGVRLFLFGSIDYRDVFGKEHHTKFCMYWDQRVREYMYCPVFNHVD